MFHGPDRAQGHPSLGFFWATSLSPPNQAAHYVALNTPDEIELGRWNDVSIDRKQIQGGYAIQTFQNQDSWAMYAHGTANNVTTINSDRKLN
jgi:hypothetical protein